MSKTQNVVLATGVAAAASATSAFAEGAGQFASLVPTEAVGEILAAIALIGALFVGVKVAIRAFRVIKGVI